MEIEASEWRAPISRWLPWIVGVGCVLLLVSIIVPFVLHARESARKAASRNNLKQIGIGLHNYAEIHATLPPGGTVDASGRGQHGWITLIHPHLEASAFYSLVDFAHPWDSPANADLFRDPHPLFLNPSVEQSATTEGFGLLHYMGNPRVMHRNSRVTFAALDDGLDHTWLAGEVAGDFQPWGYPYNWRELSAPLNRGPSSFGRPTGDGAQLLIADGSVRFLANDVDPTVLAALAEAGPPVDPAAIARPNRHFDYASSPWTQGWLQLDGDDEGLSVVAWHEPDGTPHSARIRATAKWSDRVATVDDVARVAARFPEIREFHGAVRVDDEVAKVIVRFPRLVVLQADEFDLSPAGLDSLRKLRRLRHVIGTGDVELRVHLGLPANP